MKLTQQNCRPCEIGGKPMPKNEVSEHLKELKQWTTDGLKLSKEFKFSDFKEAMSFINKIAELAEAEGHHPDIFISYSKVKIDLWTHAAKGLSLNDFILAAKIDEL
jgi:4a-hydroxytetrahydrobiopterin dehydratase